MEASSGARALSTAHGAPPVGAGSGFLILLRPKWLAMLGGRRAVQGRLVRGVSFLVAAGAGGGGAYLLAVRLLRGLRSYPEVGPILASKLLGLGFLMFLCILLLANTIAALSSFFLARDLPAVVAAPVDWLSLYGARLTETLASSSWMVVLLLVPILAAYEHVYGAGFSFYLVALAGLIPFLVIPAAAGSAITMVLVRSFPARRTRDLLAMIGVLAVALLILGLRLLRPEQLVRPEGFRNLVDFLAVLEGPSASWLPSGWVAELLRGRLDGTLDPFWFLLLWSTAGATVVAGAFLHRRTWAEGFTRAQEGARSRVRRGRAWRWVERGLSGLDLGRRQLILKDLRLFFRDPAQWSQLLILGVLLVVYVYNMRVLPLHSGAAVGRFMVSIVMLLNLGLAGFVLAAVAARFVFPAFSLEGQALWLLRSSPLPPAMLLWSKFWTGALPLLLLALGLTGLTNVILGVRAGLLLLSLVSVAALTLALVAQALAWGIALPKFETENAAQIPTSLGGLLFMTGAVVTLGAVLTVQFWTLRGYVLSGLPGRVTREPFAGELLLAVGLTAGLCVVATTVPYAVARHRVARLEA
ncbi:MAG: hypothetical protein ACE5HP_10445 [Gemmatimonadota bacterium]